MKFRPLAVLAAFAFACNAGAFSQDDVSARADAKVAQVSDADEFVSEVERAVLMARRGDYGPLKRGALDKVIEAKNELKDLLEGHDSAQELDESERVRFLNAHELITATLRSDQKSRKICKRQAGTGSRLAKVECLTVAQREARAKQAQRNMQEIQRMNCRGNAGPEMRC
jgi:hypothetical protein